MNIPRLRGLIAERFGSTAKMAEQMGWKADKLRRILKGEQKTTADDILDMATALGISNQYEDVVSIFIA